MTRANSNGKITERAGLNGNGPICVSRDIVFESDPVEFAGELAGVGDLSMSTPFGPTFGHV